MKVGHIYVEDEPLLQDYMYSTLSCTPVYYLVTLVFVEDMSYPRPVHHVSVWEADGSVPVCLGTNGIFTEPLYIHVETTSTSTTSAIGKTDT